MKFIGCAVGETRKGLDRFINIASLLPEHEFGWIGECKIINDKVNILGHGYFDDLIRKIPSNLKFYGLLEDPKVIMKQYDVLLFLSREDPCPLVIFEAKEIGLKVITLKESGDSYKFLTNHDYIIEGKYSDVKVLDCIKTIKNTNKIPYFYKSNSLSKILDTINYGMSYERHLSFNRGWHQVEYNHIFFTENAEIYNSNVDIKNVELQFSNHFPQFIKKLKISIDSGSYNEFEIKDKLTFSFKSNFKKLKISTDNYIRPIDIGVLDNRILGLSLSEFKINDSILNLNLINKNINVDYIPSKKYNDDEVISVSHSGDLGDIIYSIPFVKNLNKPIDYYITVPFEKVYPRECFDEKKFNSLKSILEKVDCINNVIFGIPKNVTIDYNLDQHRELEKTFIKNDVSLYKTFTEMSICELYDYRFNRHSDLMSPWIVLKEKIIIENKDIVISRSHRYNNNNFPWQEIYNQYNSKMIFVGTEFEHQTFVSKFGKVDYYKTYNLYELAMIINGSKLFIGNQSCPYSLAESMKVNSIQETAINIPNCVYKRTNGLYNNTSFEKINEFIKIYV
jgi:hypothetical protein